MLIVRRVNTLDEVSTVTKRQSNMMVKVAQCEYLPQSNKTHILNKELLFNSGPAFRPITLLLLFFVGLCLQIEELNKGIIPTLHSTFLHTIISTDSL
jgi:hypothetical protein